MVARIVGLITDAAEREALLRELDARYPAVKQRRGALELPNANDEDFDAKFQEWIRYYVTVAIGAPVPKATPA